MEKNFTIRPAELTDYDAFIAIWSAAEGMGLNAYDDSLEGFDRYLRRNPSTCFAAVDGERVVGVILSGHDGRRGFIYHMTVIPEYRRSGVASALVVRALDALGKEGIKKAVLVCKADNGEGNSFWEHIGFSARDDLVYRNRIIE